MLIKSEKKITLDAHEIEKAVLEYLVAKQIITKESIPNAKIALDQNLIAEVKINYEQKTNL